MEKTNFDYLFNMKLLIAMLVFSATTLHKLTAQGAPETVVIKDRKQLEQLFPKDNDSIQYLRCGIVETAALIDSTLWHTFLQWSLAPDTNAVKTMPPGIYTLQISYIINKYGKLVEPKCLTEIGFGLDSFIIKKLKECPYTWSPATRNGRPVMSRQLITLIFNVNSGLARISRLSENQSIASRHAPVVFPT